MHFGLISPGILGWVSLQNTGWDDTEMFINYIRLLICNIWPMFDDELNNYYFKLNYDHLEMSITSGTGLKFIDPVLNVKYSSSNWFNLSTVYLIPCSNTAYVTVFVILLFGIYFLFVSLSMCPCLSLSLCVSWMWICLFLLVAVCTFRLWPNALQLLWKRVVNWLFSLFLFPIASLFPQPTGKSVKSFHSRNKWKRCDCHKLTKHS